MPSNVKAAVIVFPGSNCDRDMKVALEAAMGSDVIMHWHRDAELPEVDLIAVPGGFPMAIICAPAPWRRIRR